MNQTSLKHEWISQNFICCWNTNNIKIKRTNRVVNCRRWMHSGRRNITYECLLNYSVSVLLNFKYCPVMMCLKYHSFIIWKGYWKYCAIRSERLDTNYFQVQGWKGFVCFSITKHPFEGHEILIIKTIVLIWKWKSDLIRLFKSFEFGNGSRMSEEKPVVLKFKYLQNKKW